jgi:uncharacterized membrane protein YfcA
MMAIATMRMPSRQTNPLACLATGTLAVAACYVEWFNVAGAPQAELLTVVAVALAAVLGGLAGFAFSAICGAMLFQFRHDTVEVVQTMLICSIANQTLSVAALRRHIRLRALAPFLSGGVIGVPAGVWLLLNLNAATYLAGLGGVLVVYGLYMLLRPPVVLQGIRPEAGVAAGLLGGVLGGFAATPGAVVAIWCGAQGWDRMRQRAVTQPFILAMQIVALFCIVVMRPHGAPHASIPPLAWACVPASLSGTWWGLALFRRMTDRQFAIAVNVLLIVSGAALVV